MSISINSFTSIVEIALFILFPTSTNELARHRRLTTSHYFYSSGVSASEQHGPGGEIQRRVVAAAALHPGQPGQRLHVDHLRPGLAGRQPRHPQRF